MMENLRAYILSVVCAAILCGIVTSITGQKTGTAPLLKLICGIFLCLTVVRPVANIQLDELLRFTEDFEWEADAAAAIGEGMYEESLSRVITQETEAYILDKAQTLDLELTVKVHVDENMIPEEVTLTGAASANQKQQLQAVLESELGIPKERQIWIG